MLSFPVGIITEAVRHFPRYKSQLNEKLGFEVNQNLKPSRYVKVKKKLEKELIEFWFSLRKLRSLDPSYFNVF